MTWIGTLDVKVANSLVRCPFCHDALDVSAAEWLACRRCLARHHASCWAENGACAACGEREALGGRDRTAEALETAELAAELERLEREWAAEHAARCHRGANGVLYEPSRWGVLAKLIAGALGATWCLGTFSEGAPFPVWFFGMAVFLGSLLAATKAVERAASYRAALARFERRRTAIFERATLARR